MKFRFPKCTTFAVLLAAIFLTGCSDSGKKEKKIKTKDGVVTKIDVKSNSVAMSFVDKDGKDRELKGSVRDDTEIIINGRAAKLDDVREGDKVAVSGYKEGKDDEMKLVATKVEVKRAQESDWKSTGTKPPPSPTSAPARKP